MKPTLKGVAPAPSHPHVQLTMSLFQAREWWATTCGQEEEFAAGSLAVGELIVQQQGGDEGGGHRGDELICVGSLQGMLRIYNPSAGENVHALVVEENLGSPVLQMAIGYFVPAAPEMRALAVLHPRRLGVYVLHAKDSDAGNTSASTAAFFELGKLYEHALGAHGKHFTAFNMTYGPFGGSVRDLLAVQSMDGQLAVYEQDAHAFTRDIPGLLVPGPLLYVLRIDSFVLANSELGLDCYRYDAFASAGRAMQVDWSITLGECIHELIVTKFSESLSPNSVDIMAVGDQTLFTLREQGNIRLQKRLQQEPAAACSYVVAATADDLCGRHVDQRDLVNRVGREHLLLSTESQLLVYRDLELIWSASLAHVPVSVCVARFGGIAGMVVSLDEAGKVEVLYMGTDPPTQAVASVSQEADYEVIDAEYRKLQKIIRASEKGSSDARSSATSAAAVSFCTAVSLHVQVSQNLDLSQSQALNDQETEPLGSQLASLSLQDQRKNGLVTINLRVFVSFREDGLLSGALLHIKLPAGFLTRESSTSLPPLRRGATPFVAMFTVHVEKGVVPSSLEGLACVVYAMPGCDNELVGTCTEKFRLPLPAACCLIPPSPESSRYKFVIETNGPPPTQLVSLFADMLEGNEDPKSRGESSAGNALSFRYWGSQEDQLVETSILMSMKSTEAGRFRVQSSALSGLCVIADELVRRLTAGSESSTKVTYSEGLPLQDLFVVIDEHLELRKSLSKAQAHLENVAHQYRAIEKRLLLRFKDKNPAPLNNLQVLLGETHEMTLKAAWEVERIQWSLRKCSATLSCCGRLLCLLIRHRFDMSNEEHDILCTHLHLDVPDALDDGGQGWEEVADGALTYLLRSVLSKTGGGATNTPYTSSGMPEDSSRLKKHLSIVCDRLRKGGQLVAT